MSYAYHRTLALLVLSFAILCIPGLGEPPVPKPKENPLLLKGFDLSWGKGKIPIRSITKGRDIDTYSPVGGYSYIQLVDFRKGTYWLLTTVPYNNASGKVTGWVKRSEVSIAMGEGDNIKYYSLHGDDYTKKQEHTQAFRSYVYAMVHANMSKDYRQMERYANLALTSYKRVTAKTSEDKHKGYLYRFRGVAKMGQKDYRLAIEDFNAQIETGWSPELGYLSRGYCNEKLDQTRKALNDYNRAREIDPKWGLPYRNMGHLSRRNNHYPNAILWLEYATHYEPKNGHNYKWLGVLYLELGYPKRALSYFDKADKINPKFKKWHASFKTIAQREARNVRNTPRKTTAFINNGNVFKNSKELVNLSPGGNGKTARELVFRNIPYYRCVEIDGDWAGLVRIGDQNRIRWFQIKDLTFAHKISFTKDELESFKKYLERP